MVSIKIIFLFLLLSGGKKKVNFGLPKLTIVETPPAEEAM